MKKIHIFAILALFCPSFLWGAAGIWQGGVIIDGTTYIETIGPSLNGQSFNVVQGGTLNLSYAYIKTFKNGSSDVCGGTMYYSVYPAAGSPSFTGVSLSFGSNLGGGDQQWNTTGGFVAINLASGLNAGSYKIAVYYETAANQSSACINGSSPLALNNGGANYIANLTVNAPAPIALVNFTTRVVDTDVHLIWATATERNNNRFEVEHSTDMQQWNTIGTISGSGNSNVMHNYSFTHEKAVAGPNYYRLRQIDHDGKFEYSAVKKVLLSGRGVAIASPNPVTGTQISLHLSKTTSGTAHIRLFDALGRIVQEWTVEAENDQVLPLELGNLPAGVLFLQVDQEQPIRVVRA